MATQPSDDRQKIYLEWLRQRGLPPSAAFRVQWPTLVKPEPLATRSVPPVLVPRVTFLLAVSEAEALTAPELDLLEKMRDAIQFDPQEIQNIFVEQARGLSDSKAEKSSDYQRQITVVFGEKLAKALLGKEFHFASERGQVITQWRSLPLSRSVMVTFHPRDMLRFPLNKKHVWKDLQLAKSWLNGS